MAVGDAWPTHLAGPERTELILGGQKSGKSRRAETLASEWLAGSGPGATGGERRAVLIATAQPGDAEMGDRIARHQADRRARVPGLMLDEVAGDVGAAVAGWSRPDTLVLVDCLTLWLTQIMLPLASRDAVSRGWGDDNDPRFKPVAAPVATDPWAEPRVVRHYTEALLTALALRQGPVVLVSNEIGLGVIPLGRDVRQFVDALGQLNQRVAAACDQVTFMAAGCAWPLKGGGSR